uniref:Uncharacterized protein n=2 Tax=Caenorhabditis japonica TaxID=281687 RepID=A0A8R1DLX8_CAEJA
MVSKKIFILFLFTLVLGKDCEPKTLDDMDLNCQTISNVVLTIKNVENSCPTSPAQPLLDYPTRKNIMTGPSSDEEEYRRRREQRLVSKLEWLGVDSVRFISDFSDRKSEFCRNSDGNRNENLKFRNSDGTSEEKITKSEISDGTRKRILFPRKPDQDVLLTSCVRGYDPPPDLPHFSLLLRRITPAERFQKLKLFDTLFRMVGTPAYLE